MSLSHGVRYRLLAAGACGALSVGGVVSVAGAHASTKPGTLMVVTAKKGTNVWVNGQKKHGGNLVKLYRGFLKKGDTMRVTRHGKEWCVGHANGDANVDGFVACKDLGAVTK